MRLRGRRGRRPQQGGEPAARLRRVLPGPGVRPPIGRLLRFRTPDSGTTSWVDVVRGEVVYENASIEDFSVRKSSGQPLFILANVVDDGDMAISHVIRGEDHVPNTPKYLLLWEALGLGAPPVFAHLPLLVNESRQKLSKRRDKVALEDYRDEGYLPEAMVNYLALLGWSPGGGPGGPFPPRTGGRIPPGGCQVLAGVLRREKTGGRERQLFTFLFPRTNWWPGRRSGSRHAGRPSPLWSRSGPGPWARSTPWWTSSTYPT